MTEAARRDKDQIPVGKLTGGDIVEGAVGQLGQPGTVDTHPPQMPVLLVELAVREEDRLGIVGKIDIVDRALGIGERNRCRLFWMGRVDDPNLRPRRGWLRLPNVRADRVGVSQRHPGQDHDRGKVVQGEGLGNLLGLRRRLGSRQQSNRLFPLGSDDKTAILDRILPAAQGHGSAAQGVILGHILFLKRADRPRVDRHREAVRIDFHLKGKPAADRDVEGDRRQGGKIVPMRAEKDGSRGRV